MRRNDKLHKLLSHDKFGRHVRRALWRRRALAGLVTLSILGASSAAIEAVRLRSKASAAAQIPQEEVILDAALSFPDRSPQIQSIATFAINTVSLGSSESAVKAAIVVVGRSGLGSHAEPWMRAMLAHPTRRIRREAVVWYPRANPEFRSDPAAAAAFDSACQSLTQP